MRGDPGHQPGQDSPGLLVLDRRKMMVSWASIIVFVGQIIDNVSHPQP
jgi:hypothetical protein